MCTQNTGGKASTKPFTGTFRPAQPQRRRLAFGCMWMWATSARNTRWVLSLFTSKVLFLDDHVNSLEFAHNGTCDGMSPVVCGAQYKSLGMTSHYLVFEDLALLDGSEQ